MRTIGIDPDSKSLPIVLWDDSGPQTFWIVRSTGGAVAMARALLMQAPTIWDIDTVVIEGQQIDGRRTRRGTLFTLAHVTGAALAWAVERVNMEHHGKRAPLPPEILIPTPWEWKRSQPKYAMQARLFEELGWGYRFAGSGRGRYAQPLRPGERFLDIRPGDWKHVGDAMLLAQWGYNRSTRTR